MADNVVVTAGVGTTVAADEVTDGTLGSVKVQYVKLMDGTLDGTTKAAVGANGLAVNAVIASGTITTVGTVSAITAVPTDPFGANADAASASGSISAKLRGLATAIGTTAWDLGSGQSGSRTQRMIIDSSQMGTLGAAATTGAVPVTLATDQKFYANQYETVPVSTTAQVMGGSGAAGDYLAGILVVPATTSPGNVLLLNNSVSITVFAGGASSVSNLVPFMIPIGAISVTNGWSITTGSNVTCIGIGKFT